MTTGLQTDKSTKLSIVFTPAYDNYVGKFGWGRKIYALF
jgi:hypothetical protein